MKVSYNWLNEFLKGKAPKPEKLADLLTMHSMDVEGIEKVGSDFVIDAKTTPNLNHYCLCHRGIAREIAAIINIKPEKYSRIFKDYEISGTSKKLSVEIADKKLCRRYIGRAVENIKVGPSPEWLRKKLEILGQRSINNIVDATNFVMLEIGQPLHAFDADKLRSNKIVVKNAVSGQKITTLDRKNVELDESVILITDGQNPLAIAGIKGGTYAELGDTTTDIVLESANFDPILIRKTAQNIKIQTEASRRYENDLTPELCLEAMDILTKLIVEIAGTKDTKVGEIVDNYPNKAEKYKLGITAEEASDIIGVKISGKDIEKIFDRFGFEWKKEGDEIVIAVPNERLDLRIKEDLAEEIGRIYGYEKIKDIKIPKPEKTAGIDKGFAYKEKIREIFYDQGFSEVMNYTFRDRGNTEIANPMSPEKKFLRMNLTDGLKESLEFNARYSELVDMPQIRIFEFGHVFPESGEQDNFATGVKNPLGLKTPKEKDILELAIKALSENFSIEFPRINKEENIAEFDFTKILEKLPELKEYDLSEMGNKNAKFKKISQYPYMIRDIAVFVPENIKAEKVLEIILQNTGELMIKNRLFDVFTKKFPDGSAKISYAFRLIFQSFERTLSDEEVNAIMKKIADKMNKNSGWQVR